jgi:type IV pilus assembly protein PilX
MQFHQIQRPSLRRPQTGTTIIVVLMMLFVATLVGIATSKLTLNSERATRYDRDYQIAFQAAEAALLDAEFDIRGPNSSASKRVDDFSVESTLGFESGCSTATRTRGMCLPNEVGKPIWLTVDFLDKSSSRAVVKLGEFTGRAFANSETDGFRSLRSELAPRYIIEILPDFNTGGSASKNKYIYRITAIGFGPTTDTQVVLQSVFRKE